MQRTDAERPPHQLPPRASRVRRPLVVAALACSLLGAGLAWAIACTPLGIVVYLALYQNAGRFDRDHFEAVVAEVRRLELRPGEARELRLDDPDDPASLRPFRDADIGPSNGAGNVWAEMTAAGKLKVVIQTRDLNHAGSFGFAYSDEPLEPQPFGNGDGDWYELDVPGLLNMVQPDMRIDEHWWRVEFNLG